MMKTNKMDRRNILIPSDMSAAIKAAGFKFSEFARVAIEEALAKLAVDGQASPALVEATQVEQLRQEVEALKVQLETTFKELTEDLENRYVALNVRIDSMGDKSGTQG